MNRHYWQQRWQQQDTSFHRPQVSNLLSEYFERLELKPNMQVFVPMCGKSLDVGFILEKKMRVVAVELVEAPVQELFQQLNLSPIVENNEHHLRYSAGQLIVYVGDIFKLSQQQLGKVDAIYDRGALVALPAKLRPKYGAKLLELCANAPQLVECVEYDQQLYAGPPHSVTQSELEQYYYVYDTRLLLSSNPLPDGVKGGICPGIRNLWLLQKHY